MKTTGDLPKAVVPSVLKAVRLLDVVSASRDPLSLGVLCTRLDLPKSSTLSLCTSLTLTGMLRRFDDGSYHLGTHLVDLAHAYLARTDMTHEFELALDSLKVLDEDGAVLTIRDGDEVVYVACRNGDRPIGVTYRIGMRLPVSCTATGKALISTLSDQEVRELFRGKRLPRLTAKSCRSVGSLLKDLQQVRTQGYATDEEETREGMCCIGVPIIDPDGGRALAAVAVSMLKGSGTPHKREQMVATLQALAEMLLHPLKMLR
ncbi:MAG: IclR family transcriptional regulator [Rhodocyclaceae bacterium]|nr:IclR family transcriptional regulator [Rhodocyclaceae bacterium]